MTPDDVDTLREGWDFEAKLAAGRDGQGTVPESLWETYSAMANTDGGVIVLGAKELPNGSLQLHGIADIDKVERDLWNLLQNPQKVSANLLRRDDVRRVELDGRALLVIQVPKAPRSQRPVHLNGSWEPGPTCASTTAIESPIVRSRGACWPMRSRTTMPRSSTGTVGPTSMPRACASIASSSRPSGPTILSCVKTSLGSCGRSGRSGAIVSARPRGSPSAA